MHEKKHTPVSDKTAGALEHFREASARESGRGSPAAALWLGSFAIGTEMFVMAGLLGSIADSLGISVGIAGLTVTASAVAYAAGAPLLGAAFMGRISRPVLIGSLAIFGLSATMSALAPTMSILLASRVVGGLAASVYGPAAATTVVAARPGIHRGRSLGVLQSASSMAMLAGAPVGLLVAATVSWRAAFGTVAMVATMVGLGLLSRAVDTGPPILTTMRQRLQPMRSAVVVGSLCGTILVMAASNSMYSYLGVIVGRAAESVGHWLLIAAFGIGGVLGTWCGGAAADRWGGARVTLITGTMLTAAVTALPLVATTPAAALALLICWGFAGWGFVPGQQYRLIGLGSGSATIPLALGSSAIQLGFAAGALLGGLVVDSAGAGSLWILALASGVAGLLVHSMTLILPREVRP